ncbi:MAG: DegT/DnrJ/EryC1/StrS family aminotransferase [Spartobacteria bacterium]|nr:DegT/DnrJ/EryC1/StrS family aminotransferase [Spartobacteria bacterium]
MNVPFLDLSAQYHSLRSELHDAMQQVLDQTAFTGGPFVTRFEKSFAEYTHCAEAAGVSSGTNALHLALLAVGIKPGDEVITAANSFIATAEAISHCGAVPVFADCDPVTYTIDPQAVENAITNKTRAIIPVHLFGQMADMDPIMALARLHKLWVIEDACQAHGSEYKGQPAGSIGDAGCFSFYPGKNLGAYGDAGAVVSSQPGVIDNVRLLRDHGAARKYIHSVVGWNARMDGIQAAILSVKLKYLDAWNAARLAHAHYYKECFGSRAGVVLPGESPHGRHVFHLFVIQLENRDDVLQHMQSKHIQCGIHYPVPLHLQEAYAFLHQGTGTFPVTERCARRFLSLPMFPELTEEQIKHVTSEVIATMK